MNAGPLPDGQRPHAPADALPPRARARGARPRARRARSTRRPRVEAGLVDVRARRHRLGRRDPHRLRGARQPVARRDDRHGGQPPLRRPRDDGDEDLRPPHGLAELDLPAPQRRRRPRGALTLYGKPERARVRLQAGPEERHVRRRQRASASRTTSTSPTTSACSARSRRGSRTTSSGGATWGPSGFQEDDVFLRTAISVDADGWAHFDYVKMPDYRWGIFLADPVQDRTIGFGDDLGKPVWQQVPGEHRNTLRRLIVTQGDTEPASVEQQRMLGHSCPSRLRSAQPLPGERRGGPPPLGDGLPAPLVLRPRRPRGGRGAAPAPQRRRRTSRASSARSTSRAPTGCSFFMFTFFTDRDGKFQLLALAESAFDPLSRTTRFMLTEEAHHMFVGETGILRVVDRTAQQHGRGEEGPPPTTSASSASSICRRCRST